MSFGATLGFIGGGAPLILRDRGIALAQLGLLQLIYLPLGLTFLWAAVIDKHRIPRLPHRIGWIAAMQALGVASLLFMTAGENWPVTLLLVIAVAISFAFATMDIALEALVVETVPPQRRPMVTTAKLCGASVGGMLGTGLLAITYGRLGWQGSFLVVAILDAICLVPILRYPEAVLRRDRTAPRRREKSGSSSNLIKHALLLGLYFGASSLVLASDSFVLLDLHVSLAAVAFVTGTLGPAINLGATLASGVLMARVSAERLVLAMAVGVGASGILLSLATISGSARLGLGAVVLGAIAGSGLGVPVFNVIYRWAQGAAAARDYSFLFGIGFLAALPARVGGPALASMLGWPTFFALATPLYVASLCLLSLAMRRTERVEGLA